MTRILNFTLLWGVIATVLFSTAATAQEDTSSESTGPRYEVDLSEAISHYAQVTMSAQAEGDTTEIMMATWTPGSYLVREYAKRIDQIAVVDEEGNALDFEKISKNRWRIQTNSKPFQVTYRLFCNELSVRTNWIGQAYGVLNGAPTFLTVPEQLDRPHEVLLHLPKNWTRSASILLAASDQDHHYHAANYDELVDSPIVAGHLTFHPFTVAGIEHTLVNVNDTGHWRGDDAAKDLAKIVAEHQKMWETIPYDRYVFLNVISDSGGGLEHDNGSLLMTSQTAFRDENRYRGWLSLASHEFFHTWNVRRLRPKALVNYDYESEVYTPSLWVAEGITSYYQDLMLVRAGLTTQDQFIASLSGDIQGVQRTEGRKVQSLRDSSHDAWIKYYRPATNSGDTQISYYTKGAVVGLLLDAKIRSASNGTHSLDDVMRTLFAEHAGGVGYLPADVRRIASEAAGEDLADWFHVAIDSTDELDYQNLADWFGLQVGDVRPTQETSDEEVEASDAEPGNQGTPWLGVGQYGSPATKAGIGEMDEIIAINEMRVERNAEQHIREFEIGAPIKILIARNGKMQEVLATVGKKLPRQRWNLSVFDDATDEQKAHLAEWLSLPAETTEADAEDDE